MTAEGIASTRRPRAMHRSRNAALATRGFGLLLLLPAGALGYWFTGSALARAQALPLWLTLWIVVVVLLGSLIAGAAGLVLLWRAGTPAPAPAAAPLPAQAVSRAPRASVVVMAVGLVLALLGLAFSAAAVQWLGIAVFGAGFAWACAAFSVVFRRAPKGYWPPTTWSRRARAGLIGAAVLLPVTVLTVLDGLIVQPTELNPGFTLAEIEERASIRGVHLSVVKDLTEWGIVVALLTLVLLALTLWPSRGHRPLDDLLTPRHVAILTAAMVVASLLLRWWFSPGDYFDMRSDQLEPAILTTLGISLALIAHAALVTIVLLWSVPKPEWAGPLGQPGQTRAPYLPPASSAR